MADETTEAQPLSSTIMDRDSINARIRAGQQLQEEGEKRRAAEKPKNKAPEKPEVKFGVKDWLNLKLFGKKKQVDYEGAANQHQRAFPDSKISTPSSGDEYDPADLAKLAKMSPDQRAAVATKTQAVVDGMDQELKTKSKSAEAAITNNPARLDADQAHSKMKTKIKSYGGSGRAS